MAIKKIILLFIASVLPLTSINAQTATDTVGSEESVVASDDEGDVEGDLTSTAEDTIQAETKPKAITPANNVQGVVRISTTITGNQEQPKVLYIVPWQPATDTTILGLPVTTLVDDVFDPVDRDEHVREIKFIESLDGQTP